MMVRRAIVCVLLVACGTSGRRVMAAWDPASEWQYQTRPANTSVDYYGYAPGRDQPRDLGWLAHTNTTHHTTDFETFPDFFRINIGSLPTPTSASGAYQRSYLPDLSGFPALTGDGRVIVRARRDAHNSGEIKMMFFDDTALATNSALSYGIRIQNGQLQDLRDQAGNFVSFATTNWAQWHDYIFERNGDNVSVSIDNNPAWTLNLNVTTSSEKVAGTNTNGFISVGHQVLSTQQRFFDIQSITFQSLSDALPSSTAGPAPVMNGEYVTYWSNGKVRTRGTYVNGKPTGVFQSFFENGQRESEGDFSNGAKQGLWRYWFADGQARKLIEFNNDLYHGAFVRWAYEGTQTGSSQWTNGGRTASSYSPPFEFGDLDALLLAATQPIAANLTYGDDQIAGEILPSGFVPGTVLRFYDRPDILSATLNGQPLAFDNTAFSYKSVTLPGSGALSVTFVPEPGSLLLLGVGAAACVARRRR